MAQAVRMLALATAVGVLVRFWRLDNSQLSGDESFSWRMAQYSISEIFQRTALDVHPPLSYVALQGWFGVVGDTPFATRAFAVFCGVLAIPLVYGTFCEAMRFLRGARRAVPAAAALVACLFAIHQAEVRAGRFGRMYSLGVVALASAWLLLRALRPHGDPAVSPLPRYSGGEGSGVRGMEPGGDLGLREGTW